MSLAEVKKMIGDKKMVIGTEQTMVNLKQGKVKKVYLASNCPVDVKEDIKHYAENFGSEVEMLEIRNDELGVACKKPFSISVLSLLK